MDVREFAHFYGVRRFVRDWPTLRSLLPEKVAKNAGVYDLAWGWLAGGGWNLRPFPDFNTMPMRRRQLLVAIAKKPGMSIREVAESLRTSYRSAHGHATKLIKEGKVRGKVALGGGDLETRLYPAYGKKQGC